MATDSDLVGVTATLTAAFATDPLWSWAFPDPRDLAVWWRYCIASALRYPGVWISGEYAAVSVWIPPDGTELTDEEERGVEPLIRDLIGARCDDVMELLNRFAASHPRGEPHYHLSLLGTHPDRRGEGLGMALLTENLIRMDAEGIPAYLESSNPTNNPRYEQLGFRQVGEFATPDGAHTVATMWREAGADGSPEQAMSQEDVEIVLSLYAPWERGDFSSAEWAHPDIELVIADGPAPGSWKGVAGMADGWREFLSAWEDWHLEFEEDAVRELDDGRVLTLFRFGARGKASGLEVGDVWTRGAAL